MKGTHLLNHFPPNMRNKIFFQSRIMRRAFSPTHNFSFGQKKCLNDQKWRCGLRAYLITIKVAYLSALGKRVHSKYQTSTAHEDDSDGHRNPRSEENRKHFRFLAAYKWDILHAFSES
jgi:hypothetical protein